jgi:hypothetical protein
MELTIRPGPEAVLVIDLKVPFPHPVPVEFGTGFLVVVPVQPTVRVLDYVLIIAPQVNAQFGFLRDELANEDRTGNESVIAPQDGQQVALVEFVGPCPGRVGELVVEVERVLVGLLAVSVELKDEGPTAADDESGPTSDVAGQ